MAEQVSLSGIRAVVFDKDGTLIDVHRTWGPAMAGALRDLVDDPTRRAEAAAAIGVDLEIHALSVDAPIIAASNDQLVALLAPILEVDPERFHTQIRPLRDVELAYIRHVLARCDDNRSQAARVLGIGRNTLLRKLKDSD